MTFLNEKEEVVVSGEAPASTPVMVEEVEVMNTWGLTVDEYIAAKEEQVQFDADIHQLVLDANRAATKLENKLVEYATKFNRFPDAIAQNFIYTQSLKGVGEKVEKTAKEKLKGVFNYLGIDSVETVGHIVEMKVTPGYQAFDAAKFKKLNPLDYDDLVALMPKTVGDKTTVKIIERKK